MKSKQALYLVQIRIDQQLQDLGLNKSQYKILWRKAGESQDDVMPLTAGLKIKGVPFVVTWNGEVTSDPDQKISLAGVALGFFTWKNRASYEMPLPCYVDREKALKSYVSSIDWAHMAENYDGEMEYIATPPTEEEIEEEFDRLFYPIK